MAKKTSQAPAKPVAKLRTVKLRFTPDVLKSLRTECLGRDCSLSVLVEELLKQQGRRFVLVDRSKDQPAPKLHQVEETTGALGEVG